MKDTHPKIIPEINHRMRDTDTPYGVWFYPHLGQLPVLDYGYFSKSVIVSYDNGGMELPLDVAFACYDYVSESWDYDKVPWCWMYYPPRIRKTSVDG